MRLLTEYELDLVAGGLSSSDDYNQDPEIFVTGPSTGGGYYGPPGGGIGGYGSGGGGGYDPNTADSDGDGIVDAQDSDNQRNADGLTPDQVDTALDVLELKLAAIEAVLAKYPNAVANLPDGRKVPASELISNLGQVAGLISAGALAGAIVAGQSPINDAIYFAFGYAVTEAALAAGSGAFVAAALGFGAEYAAQHMVEWIDSFKVWANNEYDNFQDDILDYVESNSDIPPGTYSNPADLIRGMFGAPGNGDIP